MTRWCLSFRLGRALLQMYIIFFSKYMWMFNSPDSVINVACLFLSMNALRSCWKQWPGGCSRLAPCVLLWVGLLDVRGETRSSCSALGAHVPHGLQDARSSPSSRASLSTEDAQGLSADSLFPQGWVEADISTVIQHPQAVTRPWPLHSTSSRRGTGSAGLLSLCFLHLQVLWNACLKSLCKDLRL